MAAAALTGLLAALPALTLPASAQGRLRRSTPTPSANSSNAPTSDRNMSSTKRSSLGDLSGRLSRRPDNNSRPDYAPRPDRPYDSPSSSSRPTFERRERPPFERQTTSPFERNTPSPFERNARSPFERPPTSVFDRPADSPKRLPPNGSLPPGSIFRPDNGYTPLPPKPDPNDRRDNAFRRGALPRRLPSRPASSGGVARYRDRWGTTIFSGYSTIYIPRQTYLSPFHYYDCPPYIGSSYVVTSPYRYLNGREVGSFSPWSDQDRYYGSDVYRGRGLRAALNDLTRFWEENDLRALRRHVSPDLSIGVFQGERYAYSLRRDTFLEMASDALDRVTTESFRFRDVLDRTDGLVTAYGTHTYRARGEGGTRVAQVRYTLIYVDGDWFVSAISHGGDITRDF